MKVSENFDRDEFACKCGCGFDSCDIELINVLEDLRKHFNLFGVEHIIEIKSGNRCEQHNTMSGGASGSYHIKGMAADFKVWYGLLKKIQVPESEVYAYLDKKYPDKYGIGRYDNRNHLDVRPVKARWDKRTAGQN